MLFSSGSLSRQLFIFIASLSILLLAVVSLILLPVLEQSVRELDQKMMHSQLTQGRLLMETGASLSKTIDHFVVVSNKAALLEFVQPAHDYLQALERSYLAGKLSRQQVIERMRFYISGLNHDYGNHVWITEGDGAWIFHQHGQPSEMSSYHRSAFAEFVARVRDHGHAAAALPWNVHYVIDSKPVVAYYLPQLDMIVGMDIDVSELPTSALDTYLRLERTTVEVLKATRFGEHGQAFYYFTNLNVLSSSPEFEQALKQTLISGRNSLTGKLFTAEFARSAAQGQRIDIVWDHPNDPGNFSYPAFAQAFYEPSRSTYLVSITYPDDLNFHADSLRGLIFWALLISAILALVGALLLARHIVKPIRQLSDYAQRVGAGELGLRSALMRDDELGILASEFNAMVAKLESTIAGLDHTVRQRTAALDAQNQALSTSLEDKETLLREVHHRVKNNLAVVIGFVQLQQRRHKGTATEALLKDLRSRIYTIELIHNHLYRAKNLSQIEPEAYYRALIEEIWALHLPPQGLRWQLDIAIIDQPIEQLLSCGQILNELLSNSLKYAFTEQVQGSVNLNIYREVNTLCFDYWDDGCGLLSRPEQTLTNQDGAYKTGASKEGLGFTIIEHLVTSKLKGQARHFDLATASRNGALIGQDNKVEDEMARSNLGATQGLCWQIRFPI